ncbi:DUF6691 family protein [Amorphus orientalis]|uniref:Membrane protein YedE/YeeE n=1 Tax=Amorphus orientalis TaxID=649198 RepID=A0AAE3VLP3_9HYPH|nr:DUF6691 family protein [Amorphus orientalis]MDQ0314449.1 putative membrane protein YedE/YeeE [Amorphus orientalis]
MRVLFGFLSGLLFGLGLVVSGMANPAKVLSFLDLFGAWDPSLIFVMGGAVVVTFVGYRLVLKRSAPMFMSGFDLPGTRLIDARLVLGAMVFGIGWGIGGYCPGPALTALPLLAPGTLVFVPAMLVGIWGGVILRGSTLFTRNQKEATA